tara:strand:- start:1731 stop:1922 length:192 start_codon:yes stop_codon:yes gene_type:complete
MERHCPFRPVTNIMGNIFYDRSIVNTDKKMIEDFSNVITAKEAHEIFEFAKNVEFNSFCFFAR